MRLVDRMRVAAPGVWAGGGGAMGRAALASLTPAEGAFRAIVFMRSRLFAHGVLAVEAAPVPVISVGNLSVGGTGKTPIAAWAAAELQAAGRSPAVILRDGGVDEEQVHRSLNPEVPVRAGRDRLVAIRAAVEDGADCAVLDDGFQHLRLDRELDVVLVAAEQWSRPARLLPRGPLREPLGALRRADFVLVTRKVESAHGAAAVAREVREWCDAAVGVVHLSVGAARWEPEERGTGEVNLEGVEALAVTSMGAPESFAQQLSTRGAKIEMASFPDHHRFDNVDLQGIARRAAGRPVIVSRKEAVKLARRLPPEIRMLVVEQQVQFERGEDELREAIQSAVSSRN